MNLTNQEYENRKQKNNKQIENQKETIILSESLQDEEIKIDSTLDQKVSMQQIFYECDEFSVSKENMDAQLINQQRFQIDSCGMPNLKEEKNIDVNETQIYKENNLQKNLMNTPRNQSISVDLNESQISSNIKISNEKVPLINKLLNKNNGERPKLTLEMMKANFQRILLEKQQLQQENLGNQFQGPNSDLEQQNQVLALTICEAQIQQICDIQFLNFNSLISLSYNGLQFQTMQVRTGGLNPQFNHLFLIDLDSFQKNLEFKLYQYDANQEEIIGDRALSIKKLISQQSGRRNRWFKFYRLVDGQKQFTAKIRILTRFFKKEDMNLLLRNIDQLDNKKKTKIINRVKLDENGNFLIKSRKDQLNISEDSENADQESDTEPSQIEQQLIQEENKIEKKRKRYILYPDQGISIFWEILMTIILLLSCILTPVDLAFPDFIGQNQIMQILMIFIDVLFAIQIVLSFFSATEDEDLFIQDNLKQIALNYIKSWFIIDFCSIFPFDYILLTAVESDSQRGQNKLIRLTRLGKLYRLIRLFKLFKNLNKLNSQQKPAQKKENTLLSSNQERLLFIFLMFFLFCHVLGCFFIYTASLTQDEQFIDSKGDFQNYDWISLNGFEKYSDYQLYQIAIYFTVQTITTVGYGDIYIKNSGERLTALAYMIAGVIFFSAITTSITQLFQNIDQNEQKLQQIIQTLEKIQTKYQLPQYLYIQLLIEAKYSVKNDEKDISNFLNFLPIKIKNKVTQVIYERNYKKIFFFQSKPSFFINWIQPILSRQEVKQDELIYNEEDEIDCVYFLFKGAAGFIIQLMCKIVFLEIKEGEDFGQQDFIKHSILSQQPIQEIIKNPQRMTRFFNTYTLTDCEFFCINLKNLHKMNLEFKQAFDQIFEDSVQRLKQILKFMKNSIQLSQQKSLLEADNLENFQKRFPTVSVLRDQKKEEEIYDDPAEKNQDTFYLKKSIGLKKLQKQANFYSSDEDYQKYLQPKNQKEARSSEQKLNQNQEKKLIAKNKLLDQLRKNLQKKLLSIKKIEKEEKDLAQKQFDQIEEMLRERMLHDIDEIMQNINLQKLKGFQSNIKKSEKRQNFKYTPKQLSMQDIGSSVKQKNQLISQQNLAAYLEQQQILMNKIHEDLQILKKSNVL